MNSKQAGFTIVELMIATVVFSVVLLGVTFSIIDITRSYYKGLANSKTQEAARSIIQDVSQAIQFNGGSVTTTSPVSLVPTQSAQCTGNRRYSYIINQKVTDSPEVHGLIAANVGACSVLFPNMRLIGAGDTELLGENMRLSKFEVVTAGANLYRVTVRVIYGDNDLLVDDLKADGTPGTDNVYDRCRPQRAGTQFCAVSELSTTVQKRVQ